jgi:amino acid transporter
METGKFSRNIGLMGLTMIGLTSILGSGWLFGSLEAAKYAGPAAIFSWIIAGILFFLIVFTYMELGAMLPRSGGSAHYLEYSHGPLAGFLSAWINWLAIIACIPAEAIASVQYLSSWSWAQNLFDAKTNGLSFSGVLVAGLLLILYFLEHALICAFYFCYYSHKNHSARGDCNCSDL